MAAENEAQVDEAKPQELKKMDNTTDSEIIKSSSDNKPGDGTAVIRSADRLFYTVALLLCMILIGFTSSLIGSTFVDMKVYLQCDTSMVSLVMPLQTAGVMVGSSISLFKLNRLSEPLSVGLCCLATALLTSITAAVPSIYWFLFVNGLIGCSLAVALCDIQPILLTLWDKHRLKEPIVHSQHALWALGVALGPLVIVSLLDKPLVSSAIGIQVNETSNTPESWNNLSSEAIDKTRPGNTVSTTPETSHIEYGGLVQYAYLAMGLPLAVASICLIAFFLKSKNSITRIKRSKPEAEIKPEVECFKLSKQHRLVIYTLLAFFIFFFTVVQLVPHSFLTLFTTTLLNWKVPENTMINTAYFGSLCAGRLVGILISAWIKQITLININLTSAALAIILFFFSTRHDIIVWLAAGVLGFGLSTINAAIILWVHDQTKVTDRVIAMTMIAAGVGGMTGPLVVGQLFNLTPMWMIYILVAAITVLLLIYIIMRLVVAKCSMESTVNGVKASNI